MHIIGTIQRFFSTTPFVISDGASEALAESCRKAALRHPARPKKLVVVKTSARHTHYARVAA